MSADWKRFLFLQFPVAIVAFFLIAQILAFILAHVPLRRERTDDFALAVLQDSKPHRILLFGDSTTHLATKAFNIGRQEDVLNLTSHASFGLAGDALLLQRYLTAHPAPAYVVLSNNPRLYTADENIKLYRYYLWNVFRQPDERAFLRSLYPTMTDRDGFPAILNTDERIVEPLESLIVQGQPKYDNLGPDPRSDASLEPASYNAATDATLTLIRDDPLILTQPAREAIDKMCQLSAKYGFSIQFVWPPSHFSVEMVWKATGRLDALTQQIRDAAQSCTDISFYNTNDDAAYSSFDHLGGHIRGEGWNQKFTSDLRNHLAALIKASNHNRSVGGLESGSSEGAILFSH
jgi:hypothetical protein